MFPGSAVALDPAMLKNLYKRFPALDPARPTAERRRRSSAPSETPCTASATRRREHHDHPTRRHGGRRASEATTSHSGGGAGGHSRNPFRHRERHKLRQEAAKYGKTWWSTTEGRRDHEAAEVKVREKQLDATEKQRHKKNLLDLETRIRGFHQLQDPTHVRLWDRAGRSHLRRVRFSKGSSSNDLSAAEGDKVTDDDVAVVDEEDEVGEVAHEEKAD